MDRETLEALLSQATTRCLCVHLLLSEVILLPPRALAAPFDALIDMSLNKEFV